MAKSSCVVWQQGLLLDSAGLRIGEEWEHEADPGERVDANVAR